ncbi:DUF6894 family protein [Microvirga mediterraneensis]|uniref:DUF6894 domain-containing protein n=1 Tax=Microvirga mediterraneensis TaxID=2754695 RepID=A0A838BU65_9HYPH|nr:hypothetical protein [Microvirga mediterraneensis]MBA1158810.1 hypothetical protein [Microvirga mediterraneensis]
MPKYFFNIVLDGQSTLDGLGQPFPDEITARAHARHLTLLLADRCRDPMNSFVAVSGMDGRLIFKVAFQPSETQT